MSENMVAHEAIRQIINALTEFKVDGDWSWVLRQIRDVALTYVRALGKHQHMQTVETCSS